MSVKRTQKSGLLSLIDQHGITDLNEIQMFFASFLQTFGQFASIPFPPKLLTPTYQPIGAFGTLQNALNCIAEVSFKLNQHFHETSVQISDLVKTTKQLQVVWQTSVKPLVQPTLIHMANVKNIDEVITDLMIKNQKCATSFATMTSKMLHNPSPNQKDIAAYQKQFSTVQDARKKTAVQRKTIIESTQKSVDTVEAALITISSILINRNATISQMMASMNTLYFDLGNSLISYVQQLRTATLDFEADFSSFVLDHEIGHYDLRPISFVPIDTNGLNIDVSIPINPLPLMPISIAHVSDDFFSSGPNEISLVKGKNVYLLEDPDQDWCYVMNPMTQRMGFAPTYILRKVSDILAIVTQEPDDSDLGLHVGDFVSVINDEIADGYCVIETIFSKRGPLKSSNIGLVFS